MLDINLIREKPELVEKDLKKRKDEEKLVWLTDLIKKDKEWRTTKQKLDSLRNERNKISEEINYLIKQKKDYSEKIKKTKKLSEQIKDLEKKESELHEKTKFYLTRLPNITHSTVPYGKDSSGNKVVRVFGKKPNFKFPIKSHIELIEGLNIGDFEQAAKVSGFGFNYLKDRWNSRDILLNEDK